ncbi:MAG: hypothetical protein ABR505_00725 [Actinomycetota bacterium]
MRKLRMLLLSSLIASAGFVVVPATAAHASCDGPLEIDPCPLIEACERITKGILCSSR